MSTSGGISLSQFQARLTVLQSQHQSLKAADLEMRATQSERCRSSLEKAVKSLFQVINLVRKHDKRLVAWHDRSPHLKSALRLIGIDRRTEHTVNKTTAKLKNGVHKVETQFEYAGQVIGESIDDTTRFQKDFSQISRSGVEENLQAMRAAEAELKQELEDLKYQIQNQDVECSGAMAELRQQIQRLEELTADHDSARVWKNTWGAVRIAICAQEILDLLLTFRSLGHGTCCSGGFCNAICWYFGRNSSRCQNSVSHANYSLWSPLTQ